ncbi:MAG: hypothetical protein Ct9H300mP27_06000 [Chloroflexota bacterium]|nr:MAG: hypothetical protein Ct9H300mP27_06000 [Chloroflexota bacterium]
MEGIIPSMPVVYRLVNAYAGVRFLVRNPDLDSMIICSHSGWPLLGGPSPLHNEHMTHYGDLSRADVRERPKMNVGMINKCIGALGFISLTTITLSSR